MQKGWGCLPEYFSNQVWHKVGVGGGGGGGWELALDQYSGKGELLTLGDPDQNTYPVNDNDLYFIREEGQNAIRLVLRPY